MPKKQTKRQSKASWNSLLVATVDSLPSGVFLLFVTSAKSADAAAQKKASSFGIPGKVAVIKQHPLNKTTGKSLFKELLGSFQKFPYGDSDCLVKATASAISRKYSQLSSQDPDQVELRKQVVQQQIEEQQELLESIRSEAHVQESEVTKLSSQKKLLIEEMENLERSRNTLIDSIAELDDVSELESHKQQLIGEIDDLEEENSSLLALVRNIKIKVWELEELYDNLKELAELDGYERRYEEYEERENIIFNLRLLLEKYSDEQ